MIFTVPGTPEPMRRARVGRGRHYTDSKTVAYKNRIALCARQAGVELLEGPVKMCLVCYWPSIKPDRKRNPRPMDWMEQRPDADNILKVFMDALQGIAFIDDAQVVKPEPVKLRSEQGEEPRVIVGIIKAPKYPSQYNIIELLNAYRN